MKSVFLACLLPAVICISTGDAWTQDVEQPMGVIGSAGNSNLGINSVGSQVPTKRRWDVEGVVVTLLGDRVPDAKVRLEPLPSGKGQAVKADSTGRFQAHLDIYSDPTKEPSMRLTVEKKGFLPAREIIHRGAFDTGPLRATLRPANWDENLLSQEDLVSILGPRLKSLGSSDGLTAKNQKDYARGVEEFVGRGDAAEAIPYFAAVIKRDTGCSKCWAMLALTELDSGDWDGAMRDAGVAADLAIKGQKSGSDEAAMLYGVMQSWKGNMLEASDYLSEAVASSPGDALALQELGRVQVEIHKWADADASLSKAIAAGAGPVARFLRVQVLLGEYKTDEASAELARYLGKRGLKGQPLRVHMLAERIEEQKNLQTTYADKGNGAGPLGSFNTKSVPELKGLVPATSQDPLKPILDAAGKNVARFFQDFKNTSSTEEIHETWGGQNGAAKRTLDQKCEYISMSPGDSKSVHFREYRADEKGGECILRGLHEGFMLTSGFASALYVFHPSLQAESDFRFLGRQRLESRDTYVVAFAQQPLKTESPGIFRAGQDSAATYVKGLAWIDAQNYQIIRFRTDLLAPLSEIGLKRTTTQIDYQEIRFKTSVEPFWLPQQVAVTVEWKGRLFHNEHRYTDFKLFDVHTQENIGKPKDTDQVTQSGQDGKTPL